MGPSYAVQVFHYRGLTESGDPVEIRGGQPLAAVPVLLEGAAPRGVLFPIVYLPLLFLSGDQVVNVLQAAAIQVLRDFYAPERWWRALYAYLRAYVVVVPAAEHRGRRIPDMLIDMNQHSICHGAQDQKVWDLARGREVAVYDLQPRAEVYRNSVSNVEDLQLDTRFVVEFDSRRVAAGDATAELIRVLALVNRLRLFVSGLRMEESGVVLEFESTIEEWFAAVDHNVGEREANRRIAQQLIQSLGLSDPVEDVTRRLEELRSELGNEHDRGE